VRGIFPAPTCSGGCDPTTSEQGGSTSLEEACRACGAHRPDFSNCESRAELRAAQCFFSFYDTPLWPSTSLHDSLFTGTV